jgi:putative membrane protein
MRKILGVGWSIGLALLTCLIVAQGKDLLWQTFAIAGWQILWLSCFYLLPLFCAACAWSYLFVDREKPQLITIIYATWIGQSINWLLPVAQIGGEIAKVNLLIKRKYSLATVAASAIGDKTLQVISQAIYTVLGISLLFARTNNSQIIGSLTIGLVMLIAASLAFYRVQRLGMFKKLSNYSQPFLKRLAINNNFSVTAQEIDYNLDKMYDRSGQLTLALIWQLVFRLILAGETWLGLYFLDRPVTFSEAIILESLAQAVRSVSFLIPGGLGTQEAGLMAIGGILGLTNPVALALSLSKRVRELVLGLPGLLIWQIDRQQKKSPT